MYDAYEGYLAAFAQVNALLTELTTKNVMFDYFAKEMYKQKKNQLKTNDSHFYSKTSFRGLDEPGLCCGYLLVSGCVAFFVSYK